MTTWLNLVAVAAGGALGSVSRYLIALAAAAIPGGSTMLGTIVANVLGCAAIGAIAEYSLVEGFVSPRTRLTLQVGFLGGLTTFSAFALESAALASLGRWSGASFYVAANLLIGWAALVTTATLVRGWLS